MQKFGVRSVLTVGDASSFTRQGGMVGLITVGDHIDIEINLDASQRAKLKISSRLLNLAKVVRSRPEAGS